MAYYDPVKGPCFRRYFGMLFGLPLAVTSFNRFPRLLQACCRRLGACLASLYFDDLTVQDVKSWRGSSQWFCTEVARLLGSPFSCEKHQPMQAEGDFLGLWHSVGLAVPQGGVAFWVRERLPEDTVHDPGGYTCRTTSSRCGCKDLWLFDLFEPRMLGQGGPGWP